MSSLFDLADKVAVITGSSRGIGRAIAERMADHGAKVVVSSRKLPACEEVVEAINAKHGADTAIPVACNISSKDQLKSLVDTSMARFGKIDIVVCNAATNPYLGSLATISDEQFRKVLENNILANNWLISFVLPQMIERKDGAVIIISSIGGFKGSAVAGAYCISKAADLQLARNLAMEHGQNNIRVNCIAPGLIRTDMSKAFWSDQETLRVTEARAPMRRIGHPDEIAGAAVFLASRAGGFINGQSIIIDGGVAIS